MDLGYVVIAVVAGIIGMVIWSSRKTWNGKRDAYRHTPLPGHRMEGQDHTGGGGGPD